MDFPNNECLKYPDDLFYVNLLKLRCVCMCVCVQTDSIVQEKKSGLIVGLFMWCMMGHCHQWFTEEILDIQDGMSSFSAAQQMFSVQTAVPPTAKKKQKKNIWTLADSTESASVPKRVRFGNTDMGEGRQSTKH